MKKIFLLILGAIALSPAPAKAVIADAVTVFDTAKEAAAATATIGGSVQCSVKGIIDGETGWSVCYTSTLDGTICDQTQYCDACFVEAPYICQKCAGSYILVENGDYDTYCVKPNSAGCWDEALAAENCARCAKDGITCQKCNTGFTLKNGLCVATVSTSTDSGSSDATGSDDTGATADTNTIAGNCPTGTTKSADGCCCMPN